MKKFFLPALIVIILAIGSILFIQKSESPSLDNTPPISLEKKVEDVTTQFERGKITREEANDQFCNMKVRSKNEREKAIASIREYTNNPTVEVTYVCNNFSPNNPDRVPTEETYKADGKFYFIKISSNEVLRVQ